MPVIAAAVLEVAQLNLSATASRIVPGATSFSVRNNANTADNLLVSDGGTITARGAITLTNPSAAAIYIANGATGTSGRYVFQLNSVQTAAWISDTGNTVQLANAAGSVVTTFANGALTIAGALSGVTTIATSGAINSQTISAAANFTGTLAVTSTITGSAGIRAGAANTIGWTGRGGLAASADGTYALSTEAGSAATTVLSLGTLTAAAAITLTHASAAALITANGATGTSGRFIFQINSVQTAGWMSDSANVIKMLNSGGSTVATFTNGALEITAVFVSKADASLVRGVNAAGTAQQVAMGSVLGLTGAGSTTTGGLMAGGDLTFYAAGSITPAATLTTTTLVTTTSVQTAAPTGGAGAWKLGIANAVSPTAPNRTVTIDIGGTLYYLHAKTTND